MMGLTKSFRFTFVDLPAQHPSPSPPPRDAIEPLSPIPDGPTSCLPETAPRSRAAAHGLGLYTDNLSSVSSPGNVHFNQHLWVDKNGQARIDSFNSRSATTFSTRRNTIHEHKTPPRKGEGSQNKRDRKGHTRSGSNMDTLATVALATSPTFSQASPSQSDIPWYIPAQQNGHHPDHAFEERPPKRARSEVLPSPHHANQRQDRPATSYVASMQSMEDDAKLLLNFAKTRNVSSVSKHEGSWNHSPSTYSASQIHHNNVGDVRDVPRDEQWAQGKRGAHQLYGLSPSQLAQTSPLMNGGHDSNSQYNGPGGLLGTQGRKIESALLAAAMVTSAATGKEQDKNQKQQSSPKQLPPPPRRVQPTTQAPCGICRMVQAPSESPNRDGLTSWISCNACSRWFHVVCAGFKDSRGTRTVDKYSCPDCEPTIGPTTYVRTSARARAAIDYAGLHQGMIRSSEDMVAHHWIAPIKDGRVKFQPDDFARIRPELLTMDYLEKTDGLKRPIVIPACWNACAGRKQDKPPTQQEGSKVQHNWDVTVNEEGEPITADAIAAHAGDADAVEHAEEVFDYEQDLLDMVMPENLTVRRVAQLHGPEMPLDVIDVKSQQTAQRWNLKKWVDYYESTGDKTIRNVISLEVSQSKLGRLLRRPKIVQDLDLQDEVWPPDQPSKAVQFYCLMSVADCYTDFHIDFGGSSVYYHILKGRKTFFFIPPEEKNLKKYEQWNNNPLQNQTFLGDVTGDCSRVDLVEGDTMLIPSGWIHAVWTPENSLVIGGNFLTRMSYEMQIKVNRIEIDTKTALKFRYPMFQKVHWYAAIRYIEDDPVPQETLEEFYNDSSYVFLRANPIWHEFGELEPQAEPGEPFYNLRFYSRMEIEGLPALRDYLYRTALIASDFHVDGVNESTRASVKRSIPKGHGEPLDLVRQFAVWVAWKTGCVPVPDWVHTDSTVWAQMRRVSNEKQSQRKMENRPAGERVSSRVQSQMQRVRTEAVQGANKPSKPSVAQHSPEKMIVKEEEAEEEEEEAEGEGKTKKEEEAGKRSKRTAKTQGLGPHRFACDTCRKRRIRCRHKNAPEDMDNSVPNNAKQAFVKSEPSRVESGGQTLPFIQPEGNRDGLDQPELEPLNISSTTLGHVLPPSSPPGETPASGHDGCLWSPVPGQARDSSPTSNSTGNSAGTSAGTSAGKKGRPKACDECRKSKRRCIHDERGQVDPNKAAEPAKPRGSISNKRPAQLSHDSPHQPPRKRRASSGVKGPNSSEPRSDKLNIDPSQPDLSIGATAASARLERSMHRDQKRSFNGGTDINSGRINVISGATNNADDVPTSTPLPTDHEQEKQSPIQHWEARAQPSLTEFDPSSSTPPASRPLGHLPPLSPHSVNSDVGDVSTVHNQHPPSSTQHARYNHGESNESSNSSTSTTSHSASIVTAATPATTLANLSPDSPPISHRQSSRQPRPVDRFMPDVAVTQTTAETHVDRNAEPASARPAKSQASRKDKYGVVRRASSGCSSGDLENGTNLTRVVHHNKVLEAKSPRSVAEQDRRPLQSPSIPNSKDLLSSDQGNPAVATSPDSDSLNSHQDSVPLSEVENQTKTNNAAQHRSNGSKQHMAESTDTQNEVNASNAVPMQAGQEDEQQRQQLQRHQSKPVTSRTGTSKTVTSPATDPSDQKTLELVRILQEEEFGLRRRRAGG